MRNEKAVALENNRPETKLKSTLAPIQRRPDMSNNTPTSKKIQLDLFAGASPDKVLQTIQCCDCNQPRPLDGYRFGLMPLCRDCRTERSLEILANKIERRAKR